MRTIPTLTVSLVVATITSYAAHPDELQPDRTSRTWYILDFKSGHCMQAAKSSLGETSPEGEHQKLQQNGETDYLDVTKDSDGNVTMVEQRFLQKGNVSLYWFASAEICETAKQWATYEGRLHGGNDLQ